MDESGIFRFKHFEVSHGKGSMKVGVDAVLLGSWAPGCSGKILDVGTGCGVIALILAFRFPEANIIGIDIDALSIEEASLNFHNSPWKDRLSAEISLFPSQVLKKGEKFDLIVSNPPYFDSGIKTPSTRRERARHQETLSVFSLLENSRGLLNEDGVLSVIFPYEFYEKTIQAGLENGLTAKRICFVRDNEKRKIKRVMVDFCLKETFTANPVINHLSLFEDGSPTKEYHELCHDLYLKF